MKKTRKILRGFTFFEVIIYLGLFSFMAMALFNFAWNIFDLQSKDYMARRVFSEARFVTERVNYFIRNSSKIDTDASVLEDGNGKLVLNVLGSGDTVTIEVQNGDVLLMETGQGAVNLNSGDTKVAGLTFIKYGSSEDGSEYIGFTLDLESAQNDFGRSPYQAETKIQSGAFIRNSGTGL
jgi:hypothetical protein